MCLLENPQKTPFIEVYAQKPLRELMDFSASLCALLGWALSGFASR